MKGKILFLAIAILLLCNSEAKADKAWPDFLSGSSWQVQNPYPESWSIMWHFKSNGIIDVSVLDLNTGITNFSMGVYSLNGNQLTAIVNNMIYVYSLYYVNSNRINAVFNGGAFMLARLGSDEDVWFYNYLILH